MLMLGYGLSLRLPWIRDGDIRRGCPLSMMFIVALYLPWCKYLVAHEGFNHNCMLTILSVCHVILMCFCVLRGSLLGMFGRWVRNHATSKCVLMSTSKATRIDMRSWVLTVDVKHHFSWLVFYSGCSGPSCYFPSGFFLCCLWIFTVG